MKKANLLLVCIAVTNFIMAQAPAITYPSGSLTYTVNTAITPFQPSNSGGAVPATIPGAVTTLAGSTAGYLDGTGTSAKFNTPTGVATDASGNVYVADQLNHMIRKITPAGLVTTIAGNGSAGFADGAGIITQFKNPVSVAIDASGNLYVADQLNNKIRKITPAGVVSTLAGNGIATYIDGTGSSAYFYSPSGVAVDASGNVYVGDMTNQRIRKITPAGVVTTIAGSGAASWLDAVGTSAKFNNPMGVAIDKYGNNVFVADYTNSRIRQVAITGGSTMTYAGSATTGYADGNSGSAKFNLPTGVATDAFGNVYVADKMNNCIRKIFSGTVTTLAGSGYSGLVDGTGSSAQFNNPQGVTTDASGNIYVADAGNNRIRKITPFGYTISPALPAGLSFDGTTGIISGIPTVPITITSYTISALNGGGSSTFSFTLVVNAPAPWVTTNYVTVTGTTTGVFNGIINNFGTDGSNPTSYGACYSATNPSPTTADNIVNNGAISTTGIFTTPLSGLTPNTLYYVRAYATNTGGTGYGNVVNFTTAQSAPSISYPSTVQTYAVNAAITPFQPINKGGVVPATIPGVTTYAGSSTAGSTNGNISIATFTSPTGIVNDASGNLYIAEGTRIRKITPSGIVTTFAGGSVAGYVDGTGGVAQFKGSSCITVDGFGNLFVADAGNNCIRKITPDGIVSTLAGYYQWGAGYLDATGVNAIFSSPTGIVCDNSGNLYVADQNNNRIRKITPAGVVTTVAGSTSGFSDGTGTSAQFYSPYGITIDAMGNLYVSDQSNERIRKITSSGVVTTLAGSSAGSETDGQGTSAMFYYPAGMTTDALGNMYVADKFGNRIRKIIPAGMVSTIAGSSSGYADGVALTSKFNSPSGVASDASGNVYVADQANNCIRKITISGYSINPALPAGLSFDATTGIISGAPTAISNVTTYTITATNGGGTSTFVFTLNINADYPAVNTYGVTSVGSTTANLNGSITSFGTSSNPTAYGACYSSTNSTPTTADNVINNGTTTTAGNFTASLSSLTPSTIYYVRAYATTTGGTTYGDVAVFTTTQAAPIISYPSTTPTFPVNVAITPFQPSNSGGTVPAGIYSTVTTFAGSGSAGSTNATGTSASFSAPAGIATDKSGNIFVADYSNNIIRKITPAGVVSTFATGFSSPAGIAIDAFNNVYVSDYQIIRKITPSGIVSVFAGVNTGGAYVNGLATQAQFFYPAGLAIDAAGNIYVADNSNNCIRKISTAGMVTTFAGGPGYNYSGFTDGTGVSARFYNPNDVAFDSSGNLYVTDSGNKRVRKITPAGVVTTLTDATGTQIVFSSPNRLVFDASGNLYVSEYTRYTNSDIKKITPQGVVTTLVGGSTYNGSADGTGNLATFYDPMGLTFDTSGNLFVADQNNNRIRKINTCGYTISPALPAGLSFDVTTGIISGTPTNITSNVNYTITAINAGGTSTFGFTLVINSPTPTVQTSSFISTGSTTATISGTIIDLGGSNPTAYGVCYSTTNSIPTIADNVVNNGSISVTGSYTAALTGLVPQAIYYLRAYATNSGGTSYGTVVSMNTSNFPPVLSYPSGSLTYSVGSTITPFQPTVTGGAIPATIPGSVSTLAGSTSGFLDATGISAQFSSPWGIALDGSGNIIVGDGGNNRIRKITPAGVVTTIAGSGTAGSLDNITGTSAQFSSPQGVTLDAAGNVYVGDYTNNRIRLVIPSGAVSTFAGSTQGATDGTGISANFYHPYGVATDGLGNVYVADYYNQRIRKITPAGVVSTFAGSSQGNADGTGIQAKFNNPTDVATDAFGNVYVSDQSNSSIRKITPAGVVTTLASSLYAFSGPTNVATDVMGNVYVSDSYLIRKITPQGVVTVFAGSSSGFTDGIGNVAQFKTIAHLATDALGNVYVVDKGNYCIRKITPYGYSISPALPAGLSFDATTGIISGTPTTPMTTTSYTITASNIGGVATFGFTLFVNAASPMVQTVGVNGIGLNTATANGTLINTGTASNPSAYGVCYSSTNTLPTTGDNVVNKGATSVAGDFTASLTGLTPQTLYYIRAFATNSGGTAYGDVVMFKTSQTPTVITYPSGSQTYILNTVITPFQPTISGGSILATVPGIVSTFAGSTTSGSTDATGTSAKFYYPSSLATDLFGNIYVADRNNFRIRKITPAGVVTTFAGSGTSGYADGPGTSAMFGYTVSVATDCKGNVYVADQYNHCIRKITPAGVVSTLAGKTIAGFADGTSTQAQFNYPVGVAADLLCNVYVADQTNNRIRKITPAGVVTTLAGSTQGTSDGTGSAAQFYGPGGIWVDASGNVFVTDQYNHRIRKITPGGVVSTIAGSIPGTADGIGNQAQFNQPQGIVSDALGNLYVSEYNNNRIRKITSLGVVTTLAGNSAGYLDGALGKFNNPWGVTIDSVGNVLVGDFRNNCIRKIIATGYSISPALPAGLSFDVTTGIVSGTPTVQMLSTPYTVTATNGGGTITFGFTLQVNAINPTVETTGLSGISYTTATVNSTIYNFGGDGSNPTAYGICYSNSNSMPTIADIVVNLGSTSATGTFTTSLTGLTPGTLYYARAFATNAGGTGYGNTVKGFTTLLTAPVITYPSGSQSFTLNTAITPFQPTNTGGMVPATIPVNVTTFVGSASSGSSDGTGTAASFNTIYGSATDISGNVYVTDYYNNRIRKISPSGVVTTLAGSTQGYTDGIGAAAQFYNPRGIAVDSLGNLFVADTQNNCIRKITPSGIVSTFAGNSLSGSADGTGTSASFYWPVGVAIDLSGNIYVTDQANYRIRKITPAGVVTTLAGSTSGYADGTGTQAQFSSLYGVTTDVSGNVYVSDNNLIRKITPAGVVTTFAGSTPGYLDGTGIASQFNSVQGLTCDGLGNLYVADRLNNRIRKITPTGVVTSYAGSGNYNYFDGIGTQSQIGYPNFVSIDGLGNMYLTNMSNNSNILRKITTCGYSICPALPAGLSFDATTGIISGTPTVQIVSTPYTIIASNTAGTSTFSFSLLVSAPYPSVETTGVSSITSSGATVSGTIFLFGSGSNPTAYGVCYSTTNNTPTTNDNMVNNGATSTTGNFTALLTGLLPLTKYYARAYATNSGGTAYGTTVIIINTAPAPPAVTYSSSSQTYTLNVPIAPFQPTNNGGAVPATVPGTVSTLAGSTSGFVDNTGVLAKFSSPQGIATDVSGNVYVTDPNNQRIRKITPTGVVTTFAGNGTPGYVDATGTLAQFYNPNGIATDALGNIYVADKTNNRIRQITPAGVVTTLAGGVGTGSFNGTGSQATFNNPTGIATDTYGNVYVSDNYNYLIRKITSAGVVSTFAGSSQGSADGPALSAQFNGPMGLCTDALGNVYVSDQGNNRIRKITPAGMVSTLAGSSAGYLDGSGINAKFNSPNGIISDPYGNLFVADNSNHIRQITNEGIVTTLVGSPIIGNGSTDGSFNTAKFNGLGGIAVDASGTMYVVDNGNNRIREVARYGYSISPALPAGLNFDGTTGIISGTPTVQMLSTAYTVTATNAGGTSTFGFTLLVNASYPMVETYSATSIGSSTANVNGTILGLGTASNPSSYGICYSTTNSTPTVADNVVNNGSTSATGDFTTLLTGLTPGTIYYVRAYATNTGGTGYANSIIVFNTLQAVPVISYPLSSLNYAVNIPISSFQPTNSGGTVPLTIPGSVSTLAGSTQGYADGSGVLTMFSGPGALATDVFGNVYVGDTGNKLVRKLTPFGVVTTYAGSGAQFNNPASIATDALGNVYVADAGYNNIQKITPSGVISTLAGSGIAGFANGTGIMAQFSSPKGIAVDASGNVYVADQANHLIRKITPQGVVTTLAGSTQGFTNGTGSQAKFNLPTGIAVDGSGNVFVADQGNHCIRKITAAGVVTTLAGTGIAGFADGAGVSAQFSSPYSVTINAFGTIYVADNNNNRIRQITPAGVVSTLAGNNPGNADGIGTGAQFNAPQGVATDAAGNVYVADYNNQLIRKITTNGYSISPALPAGLIFTVTNGFLSGTPTVNQAASSYTVTATNSAGTSTASFTIAVMVPTIWTGAVNTDWNTAGNWSSGVPTAANNVTIPNVTNQPVVSSSAVCNNLVINAGAILTIPTATQLTVSGSIANNAGITGIVIKASNTGVAANGTLIFHNIPSQTVSATVEMYSKASWDLNQAAGSKYRWQYFGIPVQSMLAGPTLNSAFVRMAVESGMNSSASWSVLNGSSTLSSFTGYEIVQAAAQKYIFTGQLENGSYTKTLNFTSGAYNAGTNLLANPYTAAIDIKQLIFSGAAEASVYLYNTGSLSDWLANSGSNIGSNPGQYTVSTKSTAGTGGIPGQIPSMQGFIVKTPNNSGSTFNIPYSAVTVQNADLQRAPSANRVDSLNSDKVYSIIDVTGSRFGDRMWIFTDPECTSGFDNGWDGRKMTGTPGTPQLCALETDGEYQIDAVSDINNTELGFQAGEDQSYTLTFSHYNMDRTYGSLYLQDLLLNNTVDITATGSQYTFNAIQSTVYDKRFRIVAVPTGIINPDANAQLKVFTSGKTLFIHNRSDLKGDLKLYDVMGHFLQNFVFSANGITSIPTSLVPGAYVVKAATSGERITKSLIIQ